LVGVQELCNRKKMLSLQKFIKHLYYG